MSAQTTTTLRNGHTLTIISGTDGPNAPFVVQERNQLGTFLHNVLVCRSLRDAQAWVDRAEQRGYALRPTIGGGDHSASRNLETLQEEAPHLIADDGAPLSYAWTTSAIAGGGRKWRLWVNDSRGVVATVVKLPGSVYRIYARDGFTVDAVDADTVYVKVRALFGPEVPADTFGAWTSERDPDPETAPTPRELLIVVGTEDDELDLLGSFVETTEDGVTYSYGDGRYGTAPADCCRIVKVTV